MDKKYEARALVRSHLDKVLDTFWGDSQYAQHVRFVMQLTGLQTSILRAAEHAGLDEYVGEVNSITGAIQRAIDVVSAGIEDDDLGIVSALLLDSDRFLPNGEPGSVDRDDG